MGVIKKLNWSNYQSFRPGFYAIRLGNMCIFPSISLVYPDISDELQSMQIDRIHIMVDNCKWMMEDWVYDEMKKIDHIKVYYHVWKNMPDFKKVMMNSKLITDCNNSKIVYDNPMIGISFAIPGSREKRCSLNLVIRQTDPRYGDWKNAISNVISIENLISFRDISYYNPIINILNVDERDSLPFRSKCNMEYPELFKEEIIERFKNITPDGILKSFKDDEDIWEFVNQ